MKYTHIPHEKIKRLADFLTLRNIPANLSAEDAGRIIRAAHIIDEEYYWLTNPDVKVSGIDAVTHFCRYGWCEGRNPNLWFDLSLYKQENPEVPDDVNPLLHYIVRGYKENRRPNRHAQKFRNRLILTLAPRSMDLQLISASLRSLLEQSIQPDRIILYLDRQKLSKRQLSFDLMDLLARGVDTRWVESTDSYHPLLPTLQEFHHDVIVTCGLEYVYKENFLKNLYNAWRREPDALHCSFASALFLNENRVAIDFGLRQGVESHACLLIPHANTGMILASDIWVPEGLHSDIYLRHAPTFSDLWYGIMSLVSCRKIRITGVTDLINGYGMCGDYAALLEKQKEIFGKEAISLSYYFKDKLKEVTGIDVYEHMLRPRISDQYEWKTKKKLNLEECKTFGDKIQYLKLYDDIPIKSLLSDKYRARDYVRKVAGEKYLPKLLGVWTDFDDIDFNALPKQFVLKLNCGSGTNIIIEDKADLNIREARDKFRHWFATNYALSTWEMNYFHIQPLIIAEEYLGKNINDYKVLCNSGKPILIFVDVDRFIDHKRDIYSPDWERREWTFDYRSPSTPLPKPKQLPQMLSLAEKLTKPFIHARADFFIVDNILKVGEITFYSESGFWKISPPQADFKLADAIDLENLK